MKKISRVLSVFAGVCLLAGCSTPESRISRHQADFDSWPAPVKEKVRAGRVDVGFTPEMVRVAMGDADRSYTRTTERGTSEVWVYLDHGPQFAVGVGVGGYSGSTAVGGSVVLGDEGWRDREITRVIFEGGRVFAIESRHK